MFKIYGKLFAILRASFTYSGRSARTEFWFYFVIYSLMFFAALGADVSYYQHAEPTGFLLVLQDLFGGREPFVWLHFLLLTPALVAVTVRRLHDRGHTGWWGLVYLVPVVGLVAMFGMLARTGQSGFNRFGADPLAIAGLDKEIPAPQPAPVSHSVPTQLAAAE